MIDAFVADASTAIAWVHPAQATPETKLPTRVGPHY